MSDIERYDLICTRDGTPKLAAQGAWVLADDVLPKLTALDCQLSIKKTELIWMREECEKAQARADDVEMRTLARVSALMLERDEAVGRAERAEANVAELTAGIERMKEQANVWVTCADCGAAHREDFEHTCGGTSRRVKALEEQMRVEMARYDVMLGQVMEERDEAMTRVKALQDYFSTVYGPNTVDAAYERIGIPAPTREGGKIIGEDLIGEDPRAPKDRWEITRGGDL